MAAVDTPQPSGGKQKPGQKRPKRRVAIRIDMTPMVDVAFLLLIFFMVTTVFRQPQALEVSLPPKDAKVEIAQSNVMTLRVLPGIGGDQKTVAPRIYWNVGTEPYVKTDIKGMGVQAASLVKMNPKLVVLIKIGRDVRYESMVDILDELEVHNIDRFGLSPLTPAERAQVEGIQ